MIELKDNIISDLRGLRNFTLDEVFPFYEELATDSDIFCDEGMYLQSILCNLLSSGNESFEVHTDNNNALYTCINDIKLEIEHTPLSAFLEKRTLNRDNLVRLVLCEMLQIPLPERYISAEEKIAQPLKDAIVLNSYETERLPIVKRNENIGNLSIVDIYNESSEGEAYVIFENSDESLSYKLSYCNHMKVLRSGESYINKLPQFSVSHNQITFIKYNENCSAVVCTLSFGESEKKGVHSLIEHEFDATLLTQICADERGGFIALVNGNIVTYSSDVQPDDVEDLMMDIPADETIVMIQLVARQIYALTNKMKVYSNYPVNIQDNGNIVWLDRNRDGDILPISRENFTQPKNVDSQKIGTISILYNNGKIS